MAERVSLHPMSPCNEHGCKLYQAGPFWKTDHARSCPYYGKRGSRPGTAPYRREIEA